MVYVVSTLWKVLVGLAVALPMVAYVAGSFLATGATEPPRRDPIVIRDAPAQVVEQPPVLTPRPSTRPDPDDAEGDDGDGDDGDDDTTPGADDDEIRIVTPQPTRVDDDDDDDDDDTDDDSRDGDD
jgi:hypothetical protein